MTTSLKWCRTSPSLSPNSYEGVQLARSLKTVSPAKIPTPSKRGADKNRKRVRGVRGHGRGDAIQTQPLGPLEEPPGEEGNV